MNHSSPGKIHYVWEIWGFPARGDKSFIPFIASFLENLVNCVRFRSVRVTHYFRSLRYSWKTSLIAFIPFIASFLENPVNCVRFRSVRVTHFFWKTSFVSSRSFVFVRFRSFSFVFVFFGVYFEPLFFSFCFFCEVYFHLIRSS